MQELLHAPLKFCIDFGIKDISQIFNLQNKLLLTCFRKKNLAIFSQTSAQVNVKTISLDFCLVYHSVRQATVSNQNSISTNTNSLQWLKRKSADTVYAHACMQLGTHQTCTLCTGMLLHSVPINGESSDWDHDWLIGLFEQLNISLS